MAGGDGFPQLEKRTGHPESARLQLGTPAQTAWLADLGLRLSHGTAAKGEQNRARLADGLCQDTRTGGRLREVELPFTRLRIALSKLWLAFPCWFVRRSPLLL